jgi:hypothetical protein
VHTFWFALKMDIHMPKAPDWTAERVSQLSLSEVRRLLENAVRLANLEVVALCEADIARRSPEKPRSKRSNRSPEQVGQNVKGFHFVCEDDAGVTFNPDGTYWTGSWVVDARHAERGVEIGAYVALHADRATASYRQGTILGWRKVGRDRGKIENGIEFLIQPTNEPLQWVGRGAGEKGYARDQSVPTVDAA